MVKRPEKSHDYYPIRRIIIGGVVFVLLGVFIFGRIDATRIENARMTVLTKIIAHTAWVRTPLSYFAEMFGNFRTRKELYRENQELRYELRKAGIWREAMIQFEKENARLVRLSQLRKKTELHYISAVVLADSGSPFRKSILINLGRKDGLKEGWPVVDGIGVVGRIVTVGEEVSRVILLSDPESRIPVTVEPMGVRGLIVGDSSFMPFLKFIERVEDIRPGDRVVTSGSGGLFPEGLFVGQVVRDVQGNLRVRLAENYRSLDFVSILPIQEIENLDAPAKLLGKTSLSNNNE